MLSLDSQYDSNIEEDVHLNEYDEEPTEILACFSIGDARICLNCPTSHYSSIAIIYDSALMCIHSLLWKKIVHINMVYGHRTEVRIQYRGTREESTRE
ncbi:unnamed protein product [Rotaria socialis]|uniref:Uncharacterized protein n=1 Tax=Rotaria socialis TaxID=392032 RepID=A0A818N2S6_9BILA|nr:unnamed protein product [Rotaria socialis]